MGPEVFISYQWGKQTQIKTLYTRLTSMGYSCWMDIYQMGGGDSLYDKIDRGIRSAKVIITCVTPKYALSANCRREVSLADALKKPIVPLLLDPMTWPPEGSMSMVFTQLVYIGFHKDQDVQTKWIGDKFDEVIQQLDMYVPRAVGKVMGKEDDSAKKTVKTQGPVKKQPEPVKKKEASTTKPEPVKNKDVLTKKSEPDKNKDASKKQPASAKQNDPVKKEQNGDIHTNEISQNDDKSDSKGQNSVKATPRDTPRSSPSKNKTNTEDKPKSKSCTLLWFSIKYL